MNSHLKKISLLMLLAISPVLHAVNFFNRKTNGNTNVVKRFNSSEVISNTPTVANIADPVKINENSIFPQETGLHNNDSHRDTTSKTNSEISLSDTVSETGRKNSVSSIDSNESEYIIEFVEDKNFLSALAAKDFTAIRAKISSTYESIKKNIRDSLGIHTSPYDDLTTQDQQNINIITKQAVEMTPTQLNIKQMVQNIIDAVKNLFRPHTAQKFTTWNSDSSYSLTFKDLTGTNKDTIVQYNSDKKITTVINKNLSKFPIVKNGKLVKQSTMSNLSTEKLFNLLVNPGIDSNIKPQILNTIVENMVNSLGLNKDALTTAETIVKNESLKEINTFAQQESINIENNTTLSVQDKKDTYKNLITVLQEKTKALAQSVEGLPLKIAEDLIKEKHPGVQSYNSFDDQQRYQALSNRTNEELTLLLNTYNDLTLQSDIQTILHQRAESSAPTQESTN